MLRNLVPKNFHWTPVGIADSRCEEYQLAEQGWSATYEYFSMDTGGEVDGGYTLLRRGAPVREPGDLVNLQADR